MAPPVPMTPCITPSSTGLHQLQGTIIQVGPMPKQQSNSLHSPRLELVLALLDPQGQIQIIMPTLTLPSQPQGSCKPQMMLPLATLPIPLLFHAAMNGLSLPILL